MFNLLFNQAFAEEAATKGSSFTNFLPLILITLVFYFLIIRPQQKKNKDHQEKLKNLAKGDEIITTGGLIGKIVQIIPNSDQLLIEIAKDVEVKIHKIYIADFIPKVESEVKSSEKPKKKSEKK
jgi:preprotein translocase subunit YajC